MPTTDPYSWNDSLRGDFLWTKTNFGEAVPDVMTPATRSIFTIYEEEVLPFRLPGGNPFIGVVGGRLYFNIALFSSIFMALGFSKERFAEESRGLFGSLPDDVEIPEVPLSRWQVLRHALVPALRARLSVNRKKKEISDFLAKTPERTNHIVQEIDGITSAEVLATYWESKLEAVMRHACQMLQTATSSGTDPTTALQTKLTKLMGQREAAALINDFSTENATLASLEPLVGLARVAQGDLSREEYIHRFGHRGPHEIEISYPRPADDPAWLDRQLELIHDHDPLTLMAEQRARRKDALTDLRRRLPKQAADIENELATVAHGSRLREQTRSECVRLFSAYRAFVLRANMITGHNHDVFYLTSSELHQFLSGDKALADHIPGRKAIYEHLRVLPPYPGIIRGPFDPVTWAANPDRRLDFYDANQSTTPAPNPTGDVLKGTGGSAGVAEGRVRVLADPGDSATFQAGEVLVANITNVGWTPLFPRAVAVVTDVGAVLSHAAIVARELGIPAVVGTGDATVRLQTGDWVRVDGLAGTVTKIAPTDSISP